MTRSCISAPLGVVPPLGAVLILLILRLVRGGGRWRGGWGRRWAVAGDDTSGA
jgi:hypothetical protein